MSTPISAPPRTTPLTPLLALILALALIGLAVLGIRDLIVAEGWANGRPWTTQLIRGIDGQRATNTVVVIGVVAIIVGLILIGAALKPGRKSHLGVQADEHLWLSPGAVGALAEGVADRVPGVISAEATSVNRRRVIVEVTTTQDQATILQRVSAALDDGVSHLTKASVGVRATELPK